MKLLPFILMLALACNMSPKKEEVEMLNYHRLLLQNASASLAASNASLSRRMADSLSLMAADTLKPDAAVILDTLLMSNKRHLNLISQLGTHLLILESIAGKDKDSTQTFATPLETKPVTAYWQQEHSAEQLAGLMQDDINILCTAKQLETSSLSEKLIEAKLSKPHTAIHAVLMLEGWKFHLQFLRNKYLLRLYKEFGVNYEPANQLIVLNNPQQRQLLPGMEFYSEISLGLPIARPLPIFEGEGVVQDSLSYSASLRILAQKIIDSKNRNFQKYNIKIKVPTGTGAWQNYSITDSFKLLEPTVILPSPTFFKNCNNKLTFQLPQYPDSTLLSVGVSKEMGSCTPIAARTFQLSPSKDSGRLEIFVGKEAKKVKAKEIKFLTAEPPKPSLLWLVNGQVHNGISAISRNSRILVKAVPQAEFERNFPKDAHYMIPEVDVLIIPKADNSPRLIKTVKAGIQTGNKGISIVLNDVLPNLDAGMLVFLRINGVYRHNFEGNNFIDSRFTEQERTFPFIIRQDGGPQQSKK